MYICQLTWVDGAGNIKSDSKKNVKASYILISRLKTQKHLQNELLHPTQFSGCTDFKNLLQIAVLEIYHENHKNKSNLNESKFQSRVLR